MCSFDKEAPDSEEDQAPPMIVRQTSWEPGSETDGEDHQPVIIGRSRTEVVVPSRLCVASLRRVDIPTRCASTSSFHSNTTFVARVGGLLAPEEGGPRRRGPALPLKLQDIRIRVRRTGCPTGRETQPGESYRGIRPGPIPSEANSPCECSTVENHDGGCLNGTSINFHHLF